MLNTFTDLNILKDELKETNYEAFREIIFPVLSALTPLSVPCFLRVSIQ
jgi:hypothetical protein